MTLTDKFKLLNKLSIKRLIFGLFFTSLLLISCTRKDQNCTPPSNPSAYTPPSNYSEVVDDYFSFLKAATEKGEMCSQLIMNSAISKLYDQFSPDLKKKTTERDLKLAYSSHVKHAEIGKVERERFVSIGKKYCSSLEHLWGNDHLILATCINEKREITDFSFVPEFSVKLDPSQYPESLTSFRLPFDGLWYVLWGGIDEFYNYHTPVKFQQFAYDFVVWSEGGTCKDDCKENSDYYAFEQPLFSPADGTVVDAVSTEPDIEPGKLNHSADPGNYVIIQTARNEFLFTAHMRQCSLQVKKGDTVKNGDFIGLVGNSGRTSEPHVHIQLQDGPTLDFENVTSLPLYFNQYLANGNLVDRGIPQGSQFVVSN